MKSASIFSPSTYCYSGAIAILIKHQKCARCTTDMYVFLRICFCYI